MTALMEINGGNDDASDKRLVTIDNRMGSGELHRLLHPKVLHCY